MNDDRVIDERRQAQNPYNWLWLSPLPTVITFFIVFLVADLISPSNYYPALLIATLVSGLWHLILLRYIRNRRSEFAAWHARQALALAGLRTLTCLIFLGLDAITHSEALLFLWVIPTLIIMWIVMPVWGSSQIKSGTCALASWTGHPVSITPQPVPLQEPVLARGSDAYLNASQEQTLARLLYSLRNDPPREKCKSILELAGLNYSSPEIVLELEHLALEGSEAVYHAALDALDSRGSQSVRPRMLKHLSAAERQTILNEIPDWRRDGLIDSQLGGVLLRRYDLSRKPFEPTPRVSQAAEVQPAGQALKGAATAAEPAKPQPPQPAAPRLTLGERLLSQTTINIALYLGAFLVIGAALILAALVEVTRLPILLGVAALFAAGSLLIKKRLPQPSFTLFIVFSFLLAIAAVVIRQTYDISGRAADIYWTAVFFLMALIWGVSTRLYASRLFSLAAFAALCGSAVSLIRIFSWPAEWNTVSLMLAALLGLTGVYLLKRWKDGKFALPLLIAAQLVSFGTLTGSISFTLNGLILEKAGQSLWLAASLTWLLGAAFYAWSGVLYSFPLFAWIAVGVLSPVSWLILNSFQAKPLTNIIGLGIWAAAFAFSSEVLGRRASNKAREYHWPFLAASLPLFFISAVWAFAEAGFRFAPSYYNPTFFQPFGILLGAAIVYTVLTVLRPRAYVWLTGLIFALGAYFTSFVLPFIRIPRLEASYQMLGAGLLLLVPELFFKSKPTLKLPWRWPLLGLGILMAAIDILVVLVDQIPAAGALVMGVYALLFVAYALHLDRAWIGYFATALAALSVNFALQYFNSPLDLRLAALIGLSILFFAVGYLLRVRNAPDWETTLRTSGLAIGALVAGLALIPFNGSLSNWSLLAVGAMFFVETYLRSEDRLEISGPLFTGLAVYLILRKYHVVDVPYYLLAVSLIGLASDAVFSRTFKRRRQSILTRILGGITALANLPFLLQFGMVQGHATEAAVILGIYVLVFAGDAWLYRQPRLGYAVTACLALAILVALKLIQGDLWLPVLTALSILYFGTGVLLRLKRPERWGDMLRIRGLGLGAVLSLFALFQLKPAGEWYVLAVGGMFVFETYLRRSGRLEFSAPLVWSMAAFLGVYDFHIDQFSYYLLAISLIWLVMDAVYHETLQPRPLAFYTRLIGSVTAGANAIASIVTLAGDRESAICLGVYTLFFAVYSWVYRKPRLAYLATAALPLCVFFSLRAFHQDNWLFEIAAIAIVYYAVGFVLRQTRAAPGWDSMLLFSGLGLGVINSLSAPLHLGLDGAIPVALAATLFAVEAFARRNVWLAFPANLLYLEAYFLILIWLKVDQPQFFSVGAAALGLLMHYLLGRAGSKTGAFIMGLLSQLVMLGTTYIQMVALLNLDYFFVLFFQSLVILAYGIVVRSRSLVIAPISFTVLGVLTVVYYALRTLSLVVIIGTSGIVLLLLGILAAVMRERITTFVERFRDWQA